MQQNFFFKRKARVAAGLAAKREGDYFEKCLKSACASRRWAVIKLPSGCEWVSHVRAKPVKMPFDFIFCKNGLSVFGDAKSTECNTFSYSKIVPHQIYWLEYLENHGALAGYVVNFRKLAQTVFYTSKQLVDLKPRQSLRPDDGILLGNNYEIDLDLIRVLQEKAFYGSAT